MVAPSVAKKKPVKLPEMGGGWVIRAMPELKGVFGFDVFPYEDASFELQFERVLCSSFKKSIYSKSFIVNQFFQIL